MNRPRLLAALVAAALVAAAVVIWRDDLGELRSADAPEGATTTTQGARVLANEASVASRPKTFANVCGIRVAVTDDSGQPLPGCPVRLVGRPQVGAAFVLAEGACGPDGCALVEADVEACLDEAAGGATFAVALGILGEQEVAAPVDPTAPPKDPIALRAPPLCAVRVELRMCDGRLASRPCEVELRTVERSAPWQRSRWPVSTVTVENGTLRWPWVAAGTLVGATAAPQQILRTDATTGCPEAAGDEALLTLAVMNGPRKITGRVLDAGGAPAGGRDLEVVARLRYGTFLYPVTTAASGGFEVAVSLLPEPF